jgi:hypothetical protein
VTDVETSGRAVDDGGRTRAAATVQRLRRDIADLERLMVDMPPHHAGGTRRGTEERLDDLRAELRRAERTLGTGGDERGAT